MPSKPTIVLGLSFGHGDSSAALIRDGRLVAAAEEERFTRIKHYALFPTQAATYCLKHANLSPEDVAVIAIARRPLNQLGRKLALLWRHPQLIRGRNRRRDEIQPRQSPRRWLKEMGLSHAKIVRVEHHRAHLMSCRILSDTEQLALFSFDGLGDFVSSAAARAQGPGVEILERTFFPHSLGFFYTAMTHYLGFPHFGDEFKVMGLSSYGNPRLLPVMRELVREDERLGFRLNLEAFPLLKKPMHFSIENARPVQKPFYNANLLTQVLGIPPRKVKESITRAHQDLARSVQARFEEIANSLLVRLHAKVSVKNLALAGGCAHNSVWVGKIPASTPFKRVWVAPAASDAGIAVGAAACVAHCPIQPDERHWALLGPSEPEKPGVPASIPFEVKEHTFKGDEALIAWMVDEIAGGKILGLFRGRMEFGPRALGSRSILADPRDPRMKDRLNERVKHRETFRPFAASVLWEHQENWFSDSFYCPAMEAVFEVKPSARAKIPAVVHVDDTCRLQSVTKDAQPFYWSLIEAFRKKTGVPMLLNTSFNDSEPIVCREEDAWNCFINSELDHLVIGTRAFSKKRQTAVLTA